MKIRGRLSATNSNTRLPVAIVSAGNKQIGVAVIVADESVDANAEFASACIQRLSVAATKSGLNGTLHRVEVTDKFSVSARIEMTLACVGDGDLAVIICADRAIFDIAWHCLKVRR